MLETHKYEEKYFDSGCIALTVQQNIKFIFRKIWIKFFTEFYLIELFYPDMKLYYIKDIIFRMWYIKVLVRSKWNSIFKYHMLRLSLIKIYE